MSESKLETYQRATNRRLDSLDKNIELILKVLNNFVDGMEPQMDSIKDAIHLSKEKQLEAKKDIEEALKNLKYAVEDKVYDFQKTLDNKEMIILPKKSKILDKIKNILNIK
jgi:hypothetical protein